MIPTLVRWNVFQQQIREFERLEAALHSNNHNLLCERFSNLVLICFNVGQVSFETLGCFHHRVLPFLCPTTNIVASAFSGSHEPSHEAGQESSPDIATARQTNCQRNGPVPDCFAPGTIRSDDAGSSANFTDGFASSVGTSANFTDGFASSSACNMGFPDSGNSQCPQGSVGNLPADIFHRTQGNVSALASLESNAFLADGSEPRQRSFDRSDGSRHGNGSGANYPALQSMMARGSGPFQSDSNTGQMECLPAANPGIRETRSSSSFQ